MSAQQTQGQEDDLTHHQLLDMQPAPASPRSPSGAAGAARSEALSSHRPAAALSRLDVPGHCPRVLRRRSIHSTGFLPPPCEQERRRTHRGRTARQAILLGNRTEHVPEAGRGLCSPRPRGRGHTFPGTWRGVRGAETESPALGAATHREPLWPPLPSARWLGASQRPGFPGQGGRCFFSQQVKQANSSSLLTPDVTPARGPAHAPGRKGGAI